MTIDAKEKAFEHPYNQNRNPFRHRPGRQRGMRRRASELVVGALREGVAIINLPSNFSYRTCRPFIIALEPTSTTRKNLPPMMVHQSFFLRFVLFFAFN